MVKQPEWIKKKQKLIPGDYVHYILREKRLTNNAKNYTIVQ